MVFGVPSRICLRGCQIGLCYIRKIVQITLGEIMGLFEKYTKAWNEKDISAFLECHHDDYELVIHSTGEVKKMDDIDWDQMMEWMVAANVEKHRCIYENDDIIVEHQIIGYGSGDREALMLVHQLKDGLMWRTESGATPLPTIRDSS